MELMTTLRRESSCTIFVGIWLQNRFSACGKKKHISHIETKAIMCLYYLQIQSVGDVPRHKGIDESCQPIGNKNKFKLNCICIAFNHGTVSRGLRGQEKTPLLSKEEIIGEEIEEDDQECNGCHN